jgi:type II secretory pathway pseudopilin PulG
MGIKKNAGFTIIESILFLGVTGLVMAVLLVGIGSSLSRERYRDAVYSFQDYMQGQYNLVANVNNSRNAEDVCQAGGIVVGGTADAGRGTSDCTIVGRIIHSTANGESVTSAQVYATADVATLSGSDVAVLQAADLATSPEIDTFKMGWGTRVVNPRPSDTVTNFSMLIVRMPTNGLIHTYILSQQDKDPAAVVGSVAASPGLTLCVDNAGFSASGAGRVGVRVAPDAINSSGVLFAEESQC